MSPLAVTLATESWVFAFMEEEPAAAIADITLVPATHSGPPTRALPLTSALPDTSIDGALTVRRNVAASLDNPSCTTPAESESWRFCPAAGLMREH